MESKFYTHIILKNPKLPYTFYSRVVPIDQQGLGEVRAPLKAESPGLGIET